MSEKSTAISYIFVSTCKRDTVLENLKTAIIDKVTDKKESSP